MNRAGNESLTDGLAPGDGLLLLVAVLGVVVITAITGFGVEGLLDLLIAVAISSLPYVVTFALARRPVVPARVKRAFAVGLAIYFALDVWTRYEVFFVSTSSTAAVGIVIVIIFSVLIIPAGAGLTYLVLRLLGSSKG
jgi:hypothetical protein